VIGREHGRMPQGEDVLEDGFIRLHRARTLPSCLEPAPQRVALRFRSVQALVKDVALPATLFEFSAKASTPGQMCDEITYEPTEPGHGRR